MNRSFLGRAATTTCLNGAQLSFGKDWSRMGNWMHRDFRESTKSGSARGNIRLQAPPLVASFHIGYWKKKSTARHEFV